MKIPRYTKPKYSNLKINILNQVFLNILAGHAPPFFLAKCSLDASTLNWLRLIICIIVHLLWTLLMPLEWTSSAPGMSSRSSRATRCTVWEPLY